MSQPIQKGRKLDKLHYSEPITQPPTRLKPQLRNMSNSIFTTEPCHDVSNPQERWCTNVAALEKLRRDTLEIKRRQRHQIKQQYLQEIEEHRWEKMASEQERYDRMIQHKHNKDRYNNGSVAYNPITLDYLKNERGSRLREKDAEQQRKTAVKALSTHIQCNTFNPITGEDIVMGASQNFSRSGGSCQKVRSNQTNCDHQSPAAKQQGNLLYPASLPTVKFVVPSTVPETTTKLLTQLVYRAEQDMGKIGGGSR